MKRLESIKIIVYCSMTILLVSLFFVQILENEKYLKKLNNLTQKYVYGTTAPRGRIYDRNGKLIVDNKPVKVIYYKKESSITVKEEMKLADDISNIIDIDYSKLTPRILKDYWISANYKESEDLITDEEKNKLKLRKLKSEDIYNFKLERIEEKKIKELNKKSVYIYYLMNKGYSYEEKIIKNKKVTNLEYAYIAENIDNLKGIGIRLDWERAFPYGSTFRNIIGNIGSIPLDQKTYYLSNGYDINDTVGISYLEYQYDEYLKGEKNKYLIHSNNNYELIEYGKRGKDLTLTIDIALQKEVEDIIVRKIKEIKTEPNTEYLNKAFVVISDPRTGEILTMAGKQIVNGKTYDYSLGVINYSNAVGSVVKGASHIVGYNNGGLKIGEVRDDQCIKIRNTPEKCSIWYLGVLDDLSALKHSSNTFQFRTAIKVGKGNYSYDSPLVLDLKAFDLYRNTFKSFGLGVKTEIDLPNEKLGVPGKSENVGHLLDFSIGQYDTYTPIQLSQYITTLANSGTRIRPFLLKNISDNITTVTINTREELNGVKTEARYMKRVKEGLKQVLEPYGTGYNFLPPERKPAGKTGTSQTFLDTNLDGKIDTATITSSFVGYAPYNKPRVTFAVVLPDVSHYGGYSDYVSYSISKLTREVADAYFNRYPN